MPERVPELPVLALRRSAHGDWLTPALVLPSPHADDRPPGAAVALVVIHGISLPAGSFGTPAVSALFTSRLGPATAPADVRAELDGVRVSAHLLVDRAGALTQFVSFDRRAWHAGTSCWNGREACNDYSIGIELEGTDATPYSDAQYNALAAVLKVLLASYPGLDAQTPRRSVAGHCDIAPGRKTDPGEAFDWSKLWARVV